MPSADFGLFRLRLGGSSQSATTRNPDNPRKRRRNLYRAWDRLDFGKYLAGVVGFEPTIHGTKNRCLTAWLHPNRDALVTPPAARDQDLLAKKTEPYSLFLRCLAGQQIVMRRFRAFSVHDPLQFLHILGVNRHGNNGRGTVFGGSGRLRTAGRGGANR